MPAQTIEAAIYGAVSVDGFRKLGEVSPDYEAGGKADLEHSDPASIRDLFKEAESLHPGGNAPNAGERIAREANVTDARLVTVIGAEGDPVSDKAREFLAQSAMSDHTVTHEGHRVSVGRIERRFIHEDGQRYIDDRMVYGLGRGKMNGILSDEAITGPAKGADLIVAASLKEIDLAERIFTLTPEDALTSWNPGSSEFKSHPEELLRIMQKVRRPDLLALNRDELAQLFSAEADTPTMDLLAEARGLRIARHLLCTDGMAPVKFDTPDGLFTQNVERIDRTRVVSTLGAGDGAHGVAAHGIASGMHPQAILQKLVKTTAQIVQFPGAHEDLYHQKAA